MRKRAERFGVTSIPDQPAPEPTPVLASATVAKNKNPRQTQKNTQGPKSGTAAPAASLDPAEEEKKRKTATWSSRVKITPLR